VVVFGDVITSADDAVDDDPAPPKTDSGDGFSVVVVMLVGFEVGW